MIHSFRHTIGMRLGEIGGACLYHHASNRAQFSCSFPKVCASHAGSMEQVFERLNAANEKALASLPPMGTVGSLPGSPIPALTTTIPATVADGELEAVKQLI